MGSEILIRPHQIMPCPACKVDHEFRETLYRNELPITFRCPEGVFVYTLTDETAINFHLPKRDILSLGQLKVWVIEHPQVIPQDPSTPNPTSVFPEEKTKNWREAVLEEIERLPPELRTRSIQERIEEVGSMGLIMKRVESSIREDFRTVVNAIIEEVHQGISPYDYLRGALDADALIEFFECPFLPLPLTMLDERLSKLGKLIASPRFYRRLHGIPIGNSGGFIVQLLCPYAELDDPTPVHLKRMLGMNTRPPHLEVGERKIFGTHVPYFWKDIPGIEPDVDHSDHHPSIRMQEDMSVFRQWAVQWGVQPWKTMLDRHDSFFEARLAWVGVHFPKLKPPLERFVKYGRLLYAHRDRPTRLRFMGALIQSFASLTVLVHDVGHRVTWTDLGIQHGTNSMMDFSRVQTVDYQEFLRGDYTDAAECIIAEADQPYSRQLLPLLYRHPGRLLLTTGDPLFDTLEGNTFAPVVYGLVNKAYYDREGFLKPRVWHKSMAAMNETLIRELRKMGFIHEGGD